MYPTNGLTCTLKPAVEREKNKTEAKILPAPLLRTKNKIQSLCTEGLKIKKFPDFFFFFFLLVTSSFRRELYTNNYGRLHAQAAAKQKTELWVKFKKENGEVWI